MFKSRILSQTIFIIKRNYSSQETDIIFETLNNAGIITLNRPRSVNALNASMIEKLISHLSKWEKSKQLIIIKGAGDKAFCAGVDLKLSIDKIKGPKFSKDLRYCFYLIGRYKIPNITFLDGITMGAGFALSTYGKYRVATERTVIAMPETKIGLFPDLNAFYSIPRFKVTLGIYLSLTSK